MRTSTRLYLIGIGAAVVAACLGVRPVRAQNAVEAPPPPAVEFKSEPEVILIPQSRVYYVPDLKYDLFRYGRYWYINNNGYWYRARSHRGPFQSMDFKRVPRSIVRVPNKYHRQPLQNPAAAAAALRRDVDEAAKRTIGTPKQPPQGAGRSGSAVKRPPGSKPQPTRKTWDRSGQGSGKKPSSGTVKKKSPTRKPPATVKKRPPSSTQKKPPATVKKRAPSSSKKPAQSSAKKGPQKSPPKKSPPKKSPSKKAPQKKKN